MQPPLRALFRGPGEKHPGRTANAVPADARADRGQLVGENARRAHRLSLESDRDHDRAGRNARHRRRGARARRGGHCGRDLPGLTYASEFASALEYSEPYFRGKQLFQVLQHDRLATGLAGDAGGLRARGRDLRPERLHLPFGSGPVRRHRRLCRGDNCHTGGAPRRVPAAARFSAACAARTGVFRSR